ncbi:hypothetical protein [Cetobacterium sp. SF1]|uniref:hypothetical protein n=1 Tax=Cetobacterium sp. SF1 TaxID=3417654 RepID=UPI003CEE24A5
MLKSILLILLPFVLNIIVLTKLLGDGHGHLLGNPIDIVSGISFTLSFGFGIPIWLGIIISILILILPSYIALYIFLRRKKKK